MFLFIGLGNPDLKHSNNRHNIGFMTVDEIARKHSFEPFKSQFQGLISQGRINGEKVWILKPTTYMNESGHAANKFLNFFKLDTNRVFVFYDDLDLRPGKCRVKLGGGSAGHNGLRSLDTWIGKQYWRVRLGIGHPGDKDRVRRYVLQNFSNIEFNSWVEKLIAAIAEDVGALIEHDESLFMSKIAQKLVASEINEPENLIPDSQKNFSPSILTTSSSDNDHEK